MTYRLLGLMSFVLLLSLAAFGLLMNHYHDQVMQELTHVVSETGRAALNSFAFHPAGANLESHPHGDDGESHVGSRVVKVIGEYRAAEEGAPDGADAGHAVGYRFRTQSTEEGPQIFIFEGRGAAAKAGEAVVHLESPAKEIHEKKERDVRVRREVSRTTGDGLQWSYMVQVDGVHAEEDPTGELVLSIPTFRATPQDPSSPDEALQASLQRIAVHRDIRLPIPTGEYRDLFSEMRQRSLYLFFGVFVLGTALSAGLASRFTRPIRRLDRGIHQLSEGDLEVEVETRGRDEIARLGRAFNEMTRKLRISRERDRDLTRREKLSALGRLAAGVAHDVRNPLHSVGLTLQHLQETCRPESEERQREFDRSLGIIREQIGRLDQVVGSFLSFARTDRRERQPVDLPELLRETARLVHKEAEWRGVEVEVKVEGTVPRISADVEAIRSSVLNLVLNSFEAMPDGGRVELVARTAGDEVLLEVADNGQGIPEEDRERVFEFAYTTREGGHGLGLAMVHQYVAEEHGGRVSLESRDGDGTRVTLAFPIEQDRPEERG